LEKLDPEVADILGDIAENFLESVSFFVLLYCVIWTDGITFFWNFSKFVEIFCCFVLDFSLKLTSFIILKLVTITR